MPSRPSARSSERGVRDGGHVRRAGARLPWVVALAGSTCVNGPAAGWSGGGRVADQLLSASRSAWHCASQDWVTAAKRTGCSRGR